MNKNRRKTDSFIDNEYVTGAIIALMLIAVFAWGGISAFS